MFVTRGGGDRGNEVGMLPTVPTNEDKGAVAGV